MIEDIVSAIRNTFFDPTTGTMTSNGVMMGLAACGGGLILVMVFLRRPHRS